MFSMWSLHQQKAVRLAIILRPSAIQHNYQGQWQGKQLLSPALPLWSHKSSPLIRIPTNPQIQRIGSQHPIVPPNLNDLNLSPNPFNVLAIMAVIRADEEHSPQSPEPSIPSPISTPLMNVSTIEGWETTRTTTDDNTFYTEDEPRRVYWDISSGDTSGSNEPRNVSVASSPSSTSPPPRRKKRS